MFAYSSLLQAQEGVYIGGFYESLVTDSKKKEAAMYDYIEDGDGPGLEIGVLFSPSWGTRIEWATQDYSRASTLAKGSNEYRFGIDLMYRFTEKNHLYTFAGFKSVTPSDGHSVVNAGLGASLPFAARWSLFAEGAAYQGMSKSFTDYGIKGGIRYQFYTSEISFIPPHKPVQTIIISEPELDSDKDGVIDRLDLCPNTPITHLVNDDGCTIVEQFIVSMKVNILFPNDSAYIDPIYYDEIKKVADFMKANPKTSVELSGHTSAPASAEYNLQLSTKRAQSVVNILVNEYQINATRVTGKGYGKSRLLDINDNAQAHSINRRIEAIIYTVNAKVLQR